MRKLYIEVTIGENRFPEHVIYTEDSDELIASFIEDHMADWTRKEHPYPWTIEKVRAISPGLEEH